MVIYFYDSRSIGGAFFIGNFVRVYLKHEMKCVKTKCLHQTAEDLREERVDFCSCHLFERESEKSRRKKNLLREQIFWSRAVFLNQIFSFLNLRKLKVEKTKNLI